MNKVRVLIVGENATNDFGGEAILPLHYFRMLNENNVDAFLVTHERVKPSLQALPELKYDRIYYVRDNLVFKGLNHLGHLLPPRLAWLFTDTLIYLIHNVCQWWLIRQVIKRESINVIHQPVPVSPKLPSGVFGFGVPVVIGPMNGGMSFPKAFEGYAAKGELFFFKWLRVAADWLKHLIPGKKLAKVLLVANTRTKQMLTQAEQKNAVLLPENGVLHVLDQPKQKKHKVVNCLFVGRLVDWKAVDVLIEAVTKCQLQNLQLTIVGTGAEEAALKQLVQNKGLSNVTFAGFVPFESVNAYYDQADIFVLPSIRECGGAVILEAMARGLPVIATKWGGPVDYVLPETGVLIEPSSKEALIEGFKKNIELLAVNPELRTRMGKAGIARVKQHYMWQDKVKILLKLYQGLV